MLRLALLLIAFVLSASAVWAAPDDRCAALASVDFGGIADAPAQVTRATPVSLSPRAPAHCRAEGYVSPNVGFVLDLPADNWNGKFLEYGCGGFCGSLDNAVMCENLVNDGYACIVSDMGHKSTGKDGKWALNNLQAKVDFGYRATHVALLAGRAIAARYYGKEARHSYFMGCSTGGRQALVAAQRFPTDFDGIIGGAPPMKEIGDGLVLMWAVQTLNKDGKPLFTAAELNAVNDAVVAACDLNDGVKDGIIGDSSACTFDPTKLICNGAKTDRCLTPAQADAVRKVWSGPVDGQGHRLYTGGIEHGTERAWADFLASPDGKPSSYDAWMHELFRYMAFMPDPGPSWRLSSFDWERDLKRLDAAETLYSATDPDLRRFHDAGGKLLVYQGWLDRMVMPSQITDYYGVVERVMGGRQSTQAFFRLFMIPGMDHCLGGPGADSIDFLQALEMWVEQGKAPDRLIAYNAKPPSDRPAWLRRYPIDPESVNFSRPVYPYPTKTRYRRGDPKDAASFGPAE